MVNEYLIKKETLDNIAAQSNELAGKTAAVTTAEIISDLTDTNAEISDQVELIAQISAALNGKAGGLALPDANEVSFDSEQIDPDMLYSIGHNWFAQLVAITQKVTGRTITYTPAEILSKLASASYIPQGYAESAFTLDTNNFSSGATGILPDVQKGAASSIFMLDTNLFTSSATGALVEG